MTSSCYERTWKVKIQRAALFSLRCFCPGHTCTTDLHLHGVLCYWNGGVVMVTIISAFASPGVVKTTASGAAKSDKFATVMNFPFQVISLARNFFYIQYNAIIDTQISICQETRIKALECHWHKDHLPLTTCISDTCVPLYTTRALEQYKCLYIQYTLRE